jgi:vacuolar-type H+-ATPase subunit E/Vma4
MSDSNLLESIEQDAAGEAERILEQARQQAEQRRRETDRRIREMKDETDQAVALYEERAVRRSESVINTESRRLALKAREELNRRVFGRARELLLEMPGTPAYNQVLARWIAEGALGVNRPEALVRCSFRETLTDDILRQAEALILQETGRTVHLSLMKGDPLTEQGVEVVSPDGRISFNNQVGTRIRRYDQDLKRIISEALING